MGLYTYLAPGLNEAPAPFNPIFSRNTILLSTIKRSDMGRTKQQIHARRMAAPPLLPEALSFRKMPRSAKEMLREMREEAVELSTNGPAVKIKHKFSHQ